MNELIYLEPDEEITLVIDRLRKSEGDALALVIPRGSTLAQSIVNLKLLKRSAEEMGKEISLVSNDRICRNLASQIGITVYSKPSEAERARPLEAPKKLMSEENPSGFRVNSYYANKSSEEALDDDVDDEEEIDAEYQNNEGIDEEEASELEEIRAHEAGDYGVKEKKHIKVHVEDEYEDSDNYNEDDESDLSEDNQDKIRESKDEVKGRMNTQDVKSNLSNSSKNISSSRRIILGVISATVIVLLVMTYFFIPSATIAVKLKTMTNPMSEDVFVDQSIKVIDSEKLNIPGKFITLDKEVSKTFNSSGVKKEPIEKATGKIVVSNAWNEDPVALEKGSRFVSSGKAFLSTAAVSVPGADSTVVNGQLKIIPGTAEVSVAAEAAGEEYNLAPANFVISSIALNKQGSITGRSTVAMTGGTSREIKFVSSDDIKNAEAEVMKDIVDSSKKELISKAQDEEYISFDSQIKNELSSKQSSKAVGDEAATFDYRVNVSLSVFGFKEVDAKELMKQLASKNLGSDEMLLEPDKAEFNYEIKDESKLTEGSVKLGLSYEAKTGKKMSDTEVKEKIKGKKSQYGKSLIESDERVASVEMKVWPSNLFRVPFIKNRINVSFGYVE